jgi:hypothetical protein
MVLLDALKGYATDKVKNCNLNTDPINTPRNINISVTGS